MKEIRWCETHDKPAVFGQVVEERRICAGGFADNLTPCVVKLMLLVDRDAPSITYVEGEFLDIDPADRQPAGRYIHIGGEVGPWEQVKENNDE